LGIEGEILPTWLTAIDGVAAVRPAAGFTELELRPGTEPRAVLANALARGALVTHFEVAEPSLEAVFIEHVGHPAGDEATLDDDAAPDDQAMSDDHAAPERHGAPADETTLDTPDARDAA